MVSHSPTTFLLLLDENSRKRPIILFSMTNSSLNIQSSPSTDKSGGSKGAESVFSRFCTGTKEGLVESSLET